jgi:hypothetical protein
MKRFAGGGAGGTPLEGAGNVGRMTLGLAISIAEGGHFPMLLPRFRRRFSKC